METNIDLFEAFSPQSLKEWKSKVIKDMRGEPFEKLLWPVEDNITIEPFYNTENAQAAIPVSRWASSNNNWEIGEYLEVKDTKLTNEAALSALNGGAEALLFRLKSRKPEEQLEGLLSGIKLPLISVHFEQFFSGKEPYKLLLSFYKILENQQLDPTTIRGSIDFDPLLDWVKPPLSIMGEALQFCDQHLPQFKILQVNGRSYHAGSEYTSRELALTLGKASEYLAYFAEKGLSPITVSKHLQFAFSVGTSFFVEIAKFRAFRVLWANIMKAYELDVEVFPTIESHIAPESQVDNIHTNMIQASLQAMSAVIGGVDRLYVLPANAIKKEPSTSFTRRIARNVQHLLKMESGMDRVWDPTAGSFYIETLTDHLIDEAWEKFKEYEAKGSFKVNN